MARSQFFVDATVFSRFVLRMVETFNSVNLGECFQDQPFVTPPQRDGVVFVAEPLADAR